MENKVTSYELSKELAECGFQSDSYCGWWCVALMDLTPRCPNGKIFYSPNANTYYAEHQVNMIKAYDCYDLLMWLNKLSHAYYSELSIHGNRDHNLFNCPGCSDTNRSEQPQNALAMAICKILEEGK